MYTCIHVHDIHTGCGLQSLTTLSIPLVASTQVVGWGCTQFTIQSSPLSVLTMLVVSLSHMKNDPSSEPAAIYCPLLGEEEVVII